MSRLGHEYSYDHFPGLHIFGDDLQLLSCKPHPQNLQLLYVATDVLLETPHKSSNG